MIFEFSIPYNVIGQQSMNIKKSLNLPTTSYTNRHETDQNLNVSVVSKILSKRLLNIDRCNIFVRTYKFNVFQNAKLLKIR